MITKREVIRRHIDFAIRALFAEEDQLPIILVASAAFQVARDLAVHEGVDRLHKSLKALAAPGREGEIWRAFNRTANYLKHANKDPNETLELENDEIPDAIILMTCFYYYELESLFSHPMSAFTKWISLSTAELSRMYRIDIDAPPVQEFRALSRSKRLKYGQIFLNKEQNA